MRILVGMSGGLDSTAVCMMLKQQGHTVVGLTIRNTDASMNVVADAATTPAMEPAYVTEARALAVALGIEHHVADERNRFGRDVIEPFAKAWMDGLTPNPCVECNPLFKFSVLMEWADRLDCGMIATGHYAGICVKDGVHYIVRAVDRFKDQSYFLWKLGQRQLERTVFPLAGMTKTDVRRFLADNGMRPKSGSDESMEICFVPVDYRQFLCERYPDIDIRVGPGKFVDRDGHVIGTHRGYPFYTVGQRKGLGVAFGSPRYVLRTNAARNTVMLGLPGELETDCMLIVQPQFVGMQAGQYPQDWIEVMIRYRSRPVMCRLEPAGDSGLTMVRFKETVQAVTPGQYAVFYDGDMVIGGALIPSQRGINQYREQS